MGTGSLSRGQSDWGVELTIHPPSRAEVKERVELDMTKLIVVFRNFADGPIMAHNLDT
jgi:hypothetical protein